MDKPGILLVNPPVYDFSAYDFWLKPYGLLTAAGWLRTRARVEVFDFMDRFHPALPEAAPRESDRWGRGPFFGVETEKPEIFAGLRRRFKRFGVPRRGFEDFLRERGPFDWVVTGAAMTYWYPGAAEVLESVNRVWPGAKTALGGVYATLCPGHAARAGADLTFTNMDLAPLWAALGLEPDREQPPFWEAYGRLDSAAVKFSDGCPMRCTYCAVERTGGEYRPRPAQRVISELRALRERGVKNVALYDDALLFKAGEVIGPLLERARDAGLTGGIGFHAPNAVHARYCTPPAARALVEAGFRKIYLGFESARGDFHGKTGGKTSAPEFDRAIEALLGAGARREDLCAYVLLGHPLERPEETEESLRAVNARGLRAMLAEFSPIPGTPDGERCRAVVDMDEPLWHNKTVFPVMFLGEERVHALKNLCQRLNAGLEGGGGEEEN